MSFNPPLSSRRRFMKSAGAPGIGLTLLPSGILKAGQVRKTYRDGWVLNG